MLHPRYVQSGMRREENNGLLSVWMLWFSHRQTGDLRPHSLLSSYLLFGLASVADEVIAKAETGLFV